MNAINPPVTVAVDSRLSDDYLLVSAASVTGEPQSSLSLAASADGTSLYHFAIVGAAGASELQPAGAGAAGASFTATALPGGAGATQITGFADSTDSGSVHACYQTSAGLLHASRPAGGQWQPAADTITTEQISCLDTATASATQQTQVTAVDGDGNLLLLTGPDWSAPSTVDLGGQLAGCQVKLAYLSASTWVLFAADGSGPLRVWYGAGSQVESQPATVSVAAPVANVWFSHVQDESPVVIFSDINGALYSSADFLNNVVQDVGLARVRSGSALIDPDGYIQFFCADPEGVLWVLRQTGTDDSGAPVWAPAFPLETDVSYVTAASGLVTATPAVMAFGAVRVSDQCIDLVTQPGAAGLWSRAPVQIPAPDSPLEVTRYRTGLVATDSLGLPCPQLQLGIEPSDLVSLEVAGDSVVAAPGQVTTLTTDLAGCVEFSQAATGLDAVTFTVTGQGIDQPVPVTPHQYLHEELAGAASIFTGSATIPPMSQQALLTATYGGAPVFPQANPAQASAVALACIAVFTVLNGQVPADVTGYSLDLASDPQAPVFQTLHSAGDPDAALPAGGQLAGSIWEDLGAFCDDVLHAVRQGAIAIAGWTIDAVHQTISLAVQIADGVCATLRDIALDSLDVAIPLVHGMLNWLGASVEVALDWLKDLLPWAEIWSTMDTFSGYLTGGLQGLSGLIEHKAVIATGHFFAGLQSRIDTAFDQAAAILGGQPLRPDSGPRPLVPPFTPAPGTLPGSAVTSNWLTGKLTTYLPQADWISGVGLTEDMASQFISAIQSAGVTDKISDEVTALRNFLETAWNSGGELSGTLVSSLLDVLKGLFDVATGLADTIVTLLLDLISDALSALATFLAAPLPPVPLLTPLWEHVRPADSTDQLTLGNLICLALAIPVTLIMTYYGGPSQPPEASDRGAPGDAGQITWLSLAQFAASMVLIPIDAINDGMSSLDQTTPVSLIFSLIDFVANAVVQVLFWPVGPPLAGWDWDWDAMSTGDKITNATWLGYWVPIGLDGILSLIDALSYKYTWSRVSDALLPVNIGVDTISGIILIGSGIWGSVLQMNETPPDAGALDVYSAVVGPLPWATQTLVLPSWAAASDGITVAIQVFVDLIGDYDWYGYWTN